MYAESLREHPFHYILIDVARITKNVCDGSENCIQHRFAWISHLRNVTWYILRSQCLYLVPNFIW